RSVEVKDFSGGSFNLFVPMPEKIATGDAYKVYAGCDKSFNTCKDKYNNSVNFRAFPYIPGADNMNLVDRDG
ncbi:MAG: phage BR0599 family protein, partial [Actinobacteria bacterium]|nr:phage BR0599 family protein [Actinomycetota bacterium]